MTGSLIIQLVITLFPPGQFIIGAAPRHPIVADPNDPVIRTDDAGPHLSGGVLATHRRQEGDGHEVVAPLQVVGSLLAGLHWRHWII